MEYPLISEYREAILSAEDNFNEMSSLRPVLDSHGNPVMSSGNFAVVFKMKDENDGKYYAVKCFIKEQEGRDESYRKIADELEAVSSSYILPLRYLADELFVDSQQCNQDEFPVVVMEWVEGETLDAYINRNLDKKYELEMLSYRFNRLSAWLLAQPFAHGDLKPDNILVRKDGSLVLVDYDGMFVPSMDGEKAREIGSPNYRHPLRSDSDFNEHIDDFPIAVIALSLKAIALNPALRRDTEMLDRLLFDESEFRDLSVSKTNSDIQSMISDKDISLLYAAFMVALSRNSLDLVSFRLFMTDKPKKSDCETERLSTEVSESDLAEGIPDEFGVLYSPDGKRLLKCKANLTNYTIKPGTKVIGNEALSWCSSLQSINIPDSVTAIGNSAFHQCKSLQSINIPDSVTAIGNDAFYGCESLQSINIPDSVTAIGDSAFSWCVSLQSINIPDSVTAIGNNPFSGCPSICIEVSPKSTYKVLDDFLIDRTGCIVSYFGKSRNVSIPSTASRIGDSAFSGCESLQNINIPDSVTAIGDYAFYGCESLQS
ncbi:MAG: leucine-rich repeat protein, partial [Muribaculaceae bacterium]|nr:leucine-rich repeat protein [Muribaculaceae bacterium]